MSRNPLVVDVVAAAVIVVLVLIIEPGVAVAAILALILLVVCGLSYLVARRPRRRPAAVPRRAPAGRAPRSRRR